MGDDHTTLDRQAIEHEASGGRDWTVTREVSEDGPIVGDRVTFSKPLDEADVAGFAAASGDTNRLHLDADFAEVTRFGEPVVHGSLAAGLISAALARLPGLVIYLSQELSFVAPVPVGDRPTAAVEVVESFDDGRLRLSTTVHRADGELAVEGEAVVLIDDPPEPDDG